MTIHQLLVLSAAAFALSAVFTFSLRTSSDSCDASGRRSDFELTTELGQESGEPDTAPDVEIRADVEAFLRDQESEIPSAG